MNAASQKLAESEWLQVMMEEVARKRDEDERSRRELELRAAEAAARQPATPSGSAAPPGAARPRRKGSR